MIQGIDISKHQGVVNFDALAGSDFKFVYVKGTEGVGYVDPYFSYNWSNLRKHEDKLFRGVYHFARPDTGGGEKDGIAEAKSLVAELKHEGGTERMLPPALDYEKYTPMNTATDQAFVRAFVKTVEDGLGRSPVIYTGRNVWRYQLGNTPEFSHLPLWLVRYTTAQLKEPHKPLPWDRWTFWQWSGGGDFAFAGDVPGVKGKCDVNRFNGTEKDLAALCNIETANEVTAERIRAMFHFHMGEADRLSDIHRELTGSEP